MIRSLAFTTQGRLHSRDVHVFLMPTVLNDTNLFLWVDLENPTPEETKMVLEDIFHFHPLAIEDCVMISPSPKVEEFLPKEDDSFAPHLFMVIHAVDFSRKEGEFDTNELNFFLGKNFLVTYHERPIRAVQGVEELACKGTVHIAKAPDRVAQRVLDAIVEGYKPALDELALEISELEQAALQSPGKETLNRILEVKKEVIHLRQIVAPQREVLSRFAQGEFKLVRAHMVPYYRDVYDQLSQIAVAAHGYADSITNILQIYLSMSANKTSETVKALTLITILSTPATLIASWYGMNFSLESGMVEVNWGHGYAFAFTLTAITTLGTYWYLKRRGWF